MHLNPIHVYNAAVWHQEQAMKCGKYSEERERHEGISAELFNQVNRMEKNNAGQ